MDQHILKCIFVLDELYRVEHRSRRVLGRRNPCHVLQFAVDCGDRGVRVDTEMCLPGKRDTVGASPDTRDAEYCRLVSRGASGALPDLRVRVLFCASIGNFAPDTG